MSISVQANTPGLQSFVGSTVVVDQHSWLPTTHQMPVAACPHQLLQTKMSARVMFTRKQNQSSLRNPARANTSQFCTQTRINWWIETAWVNISLKTIKDWTKDKKWEDLFLGPVFCGRQWADWPKAKWQIPESCWSTRPSCASFSFLVKWLMVEQTS